MFMTLFILVLVQGLVSSEEENGHNRIPCFDIMEKHERQNFTDVLPNAGEILHHCPVVKEHIDCLIRFSPSITEVYFDMGDLLSIRSFLEDMCDETSQLHQGYVNNFDCFISLADEWQGCKAIAPGMIEEFRKSSYALQSIDFGDMFDNEEDFKEYRSFAEAHCLRNAHALACTGIKIQETCGHEAFETFVEIIKRGQFDIEFCDGYAVKQFMKGYLDYLSAENKPTEVDIIRDLFDVETD